MITSLKTSVDTSKTNVLVYYSLNFADGALPWLRIRGPAQYLGWQAVPGNEWTEVWPDKVTEADVVIVQRDFPRLEAEFADICQLAAVQGKPVILDLDDLLLDMPPEHPDRQSNYYASALLPVLRALRQVDLVTVSTPALAELLRPWSFPIAVLPNLLDEQIWLSTDPEVEKRKATNSEMGASVVIAYWGGSPHYPDLAWIGPVLARLLQRFSGVSLQIWGPDLPAELAEHPQVFRSPLEIYRYAEYADFVRRQMLEKGVDLVISPLLDNHFNRCKSGIKFLENSALGLPGVYSSLEPYLDLVEDGVNGLLADSLEAWEAALTRLVLDAELRQRLGRQARQTALGSWRMSTQANRWQQVYAQVRAGQQIPGAASQQDELLYRVVEQMHHAYLSGKRSILDGPADTNPAARLWQVEKDLRTAQEQLADLQRSRAWKLIQPIWRMRAALRRNDQGRDLR